MLRSTCRIFVGVSAWNTIFRRNRSMIIIDAAVETGGMWVLLWRLPGHPEEVCAMSAIITDVIGARGGAVS